MKGRGGEIYTVVVWADMSYHMVGVSIVLWRRVLGLQRGSPDVWLWPLAILSVWCSQVSSGPVEQSIPDLPAWSTSSHHNQSQVSQSVSQSTRSGLK